MSLLAFPAQALSQLHHRPLYSTMSSSRPKPKWGYCHAPRLHSAHSLPPSLSRLRKRHAQLIFHWEPRTLYTKIPSFPHRDLQVPYLNPRQKKIRTVDPSPLPQLITSSKVVPPPSIEETQDPTVTSCSQSRSIHRCH